MKAVKWIVISGVLYDELGPWRVSGSGKTTATSYLVRRYFVRRQCLADPLKNFIKQVFGTDWNRRLWDDSGMRDLPDKELTRADGEPLTARYALETLGEALWQCHPRAMACMLARNSTRIPGTIVVPDVRRRSEFKCLRYLPGSFTIRLQRFSPKPSRFCSESLGIFERDMLTVPASDFDWILDGGRCVDDLYRNIDELAEHLGLERR